MQRDEIVSRICDVVACECRAAFGSRLLSVILTGSAARGEATIVSSENGWKILGDAEFLVVLRQGRGAASGPSRDTVRRESVEKLLLLGIQVTIDLGVVPLSYLKGLPARIFSYELRECGKVISGNPQILDVIPRFAASAISREDAWRLLSNRMIEQLEFVGDLERTSQQLNSGLCYSTVKLYLDTATSYLIFAGEYEPTYCGRARRLSILASHSPHDAPFPLKEFETTFAECTAWKLSGSEDGCSRPLQFWKDAISYAHQLWRWEIMQMTRASNDSSDTDLWEGLARTATVPEKARGWLSVVKRSSRSETLRNWPRWLKLACRATPRYWIYRAGAEVLFNLPAVRTDSPGQALVDSPNLPLLSLLPVCPMKADSPEVSWQFVAAEIAGNYWRYVAGTRA